MGKIIKNKIEGMSWWMKASLVLMLTLATTVFMYEGWYKPKQTQAAVAVLQGFSNTPTFTAAATTGSGTFTVTAGSNRILLVAVEADSGGTNTGGAFTVTYGGQTLTQAVVSDAAQRRISWLGYLKESQIAAATSTTLAVTASPLSTTTPALRVYASTFTGVDQTTPINATYSLYEATLAYFSYSIAVPAGGYGVFATTVNNANAPTITVDTGYTTTSVSSASGNTNYSQCGSKAYASAGNASPTITYSAAIRGAIAAATLNPAASGDTVTVGTTAPIATSPQNNNATGLVMQRIPVTVNANSATINSISLSNSGTAAAIATTAKVYVSTTDQTTGTLPTGATLIGQATLSGTTTVPITLTNTTVTSTATQYLYIVYDLGGGATTGSLVSDIEALGVAAPDSVSFGTPAPRVSNSITLQAPPAGDTVTVGATAPIATSPQTNNVTGLVMQRIPLSVNANSATLNSITLSNNGTAATIGTTAKVYVSPTDLTTGQLPSGATQIGSATLNGTTNVAFTLADTTIVPTTTQYLYIVYDLSGGSTGTLVSEIDAVGVAAPDTVSFGTPVPRVSNTITLNAAPVTNINSCGGCHGHPNGPNALVDSTGGRNNPPGSFQGSHEKHVTTAGSCATCHTTPTTLDHANGTITMAASINGGTYSVSSPIAVSNAANRTLGTCSGTSCHASVYSATSGTSPNWGTSGGGCGACHKNDGTNANGTFQANGAPATGGHAMHMNVLNTTCGDCHVGAVSGVSGGALHGNGFINVSTGYTSTNPSRNKVAKRLSGGTYYTCNNASCHANPYSAGTITTGLWGSGTGGCTACHTGTGAFINYSTSAAGNVSNPQQNGPNTGSHSGHMNYGRYICGQCHAGAVTGSTGGNKHGNGFINVTGMGGGYPQAGIAKHAIGTYTATGCANACHEGVGGTAAPIWGATTLGCLDCHNAVIKRTKGRPGATLGAVKAEFGLAWGHRNSARTTANGAVANSDCIVCHLEGKYTGAVGSTVVTAKYHADGNIDLRDPWGSGETPITNMSNGAFTFQRFTTSFQAGTRSSALNNTNIAQVISLRFCMRCHSKQGATNPLARSNNGGTATATMPFGGINLGANYTVNNGASVAGGVVNVFSAFSSGNSSVHPVRGPRVKDYPTAARLNDPYKPTGTRGTAGTKTAGIILNCFDCHNASASPKTLRTVAAHGNNETIRGTIGTTTMNLCYVCHAGYTVSNNHGTGSAMASSTGRSGEGFNSGCYSCHGDSGDTDAGTAPTTARPLRATNYHGFNALASGAAWTSPGARPYAFIRNTVTYAGGYHRPQRGMGGELTTGSATCSASSGCAANGGTRTYSPGGQY